MKRKTTIGLLIMFFFPFIWQSKANTLTKVTSIEEIIAPPANDECANATSLTVNTDFLCTTVTSGTVLEATASPESTAGCSVLSANANDDVWFKFVATATEHKIELLNILGSPTDLYHIVYDGGGTGDCNSMTPIFCADPESSDQSGLTIGNTYFIRVFTNSSAPGATTTFDVCVGTTPSAPSNDDCANAESIGIPHGPTMYDASAATNNSGSISVTDCIDINDGVWYTMTGDGNKLTVKVIPMSWDAAITVYEGSCGSFTCVEDSNLGTSGVVEAAVFNSVLSTVYYINVAHPGTADNEEGAFELEVTSEVLSIDDIIAKGFSYYPNPVRDKLRMSANETINQISLYSIIGREIKTITNSELTAELDFSDLPSGTYFLRAVIGNKSGSIKIIKE